MRSLLLYYTGTSTNGAIHNGNMDCQLEGKLNMVAIEEMKVRISRELSRVGFDVPKKNLSIVNIMELES